MRQEGLKEELKDLLRKAESHPIMRKITADRAAELLARREEAAAKAAALRKAQVEVIPKLQADLAAKEGAFLTAKAALDAAGGELQAAKAALAGEVHQFEVAIGLQEQVLRETADPAIDEAVAFFRGRLDALRKPGVIVKIGRASKTDVFKWLKITEVETNADAVRGAIKYCQAAVMELELLRLSPALDVGRIQELKGGVPAIDEFREVTGEKPMPREVTDPRLLLPSDDQIAWSLAKVNAEFDAWKAESLKPKPRPKRSLATYHAGGRETR